MAHGKGNSTSGEMEMPRCCERIILSTGWTPTTDPTPHKVQWNHNTRVFTYNIPAGLYPYSVMIHHQDTQWGLRKEPCKLTFLVPHEKGKRPELVLGSPYAVFTSTRFDARMFHVIRQLDFVIENGGSYFSPCDIKGRIMSGKGLTLDVWCYVREETKYKEPLSPVKEEPVSPPVKEEPVSPLVKEEVVPEPVGQ